jgi:hypothetical protein
MIRDDTGNPIRATHYPGSDEDPTRPPPLLQERKPGDWKNFRCKMCDEYGVSRWNASNNCFDRKTPCSICAMNNGGVWGFEERRSEDWDVSYGMMKSLGMLPGMDSITDVINGNNPEPPIRELPPLPEEIVLGFVQNGIFNHLRWKDIMDTEEGPTKNRRKVSSDNYRRKSVRPDTETAEVKDIEDHWYWWKLIGLCTDQETNTRCVLPKRLCKKMREMLIKEDPIFFSTMDPEDWTNFFECEIEPRHVCMVFNNAMDKYLNSVCDGNEEWSSEISRNILQRNSYHIEYREMSFEKLDIDSERVQFADNDLDWLFTWVAPCLLTTGGQSTTLSSEVELIARKNAKFYCLRYSGMPFSASVKILRILDRNVFGTNIMNIICPSCMGETGTRHNDWSLSRIPRDDSVNPEQYPDIHCVWENCPMPEDEIEEFHYNESKYVCVFEECGDIDLVEGTPCLSDRDVEKEYREDLLNESTVDEIFSSVYDGEFENEDDYEDEYEDEDKRKAKVALMKLGELIDDSIKDNVPQNEYLNIMNQMGEVYKLLK